MRSCRLVGLWSLLLAKCPTFLSLEAPQKPKKFFFLANRGATVASVETHCLMHHLLRAAGWDRPQARRHVEKIHKYTCCLVQFSTFLDSPCSLLFPWLSRFEMVYLSSPGFQIKLCKYQLTPLSSAHFSYHRYACQAFSPVICIEYWGFLIYQRVVLWRKWYHIPGKKTCWKYQREVDRKAYDMHVKATLTISLVGAVLRMEGTWNKGKAIQASGAAPLDDSCEGQTQSGTIMFSYSRVSPTAVKLVNDTVLLYFVINICCCIFLYIYHYWLKIKLPLPGG